jgi:hypothetical protein
LSDVLPDTHDIGQAFSNTLHERNAAM